MTENHLEINLRGIAKKDRVLAETLRQSYQPDYPELRLAKDGSPVPVIQRKCLHSVYEPAAEAARWVKTLNLKVDDRAVYVIGGLGFGYHLVELAKIIPPERLIIIEKEVALAASALLNRPPAVFPEGLRFIVGQRPATALRLAEELAASAQQTLIFLEHPASSQVFPDYYLTLKGMFRTREVAHRGGYKILLVSPLYGGSLPITYSVQRALTNLGHRCELLDNTIFYPGYQHLQMLTSNRTHSAQLIANMQSLMAESVTARALEIKADLVLALAQAPLTRDVLIELSKADIPTAFWFVEDARSFEYWKAIAPHYDHFFTIQKDEFIEQLKQIGCKNPYYLPTAADPTINCPIQLIPEDLVEFGSDLSHVGAGYHNRRQFFTGLLDYNFKIWGSDWDKAGILDRVIQRQGARVSAEDTTKVFNATAININLHSSQYHDGVNPFGDFLNPRTFEIASCGAFQLVDERKYLNENFRIGFELDTFASLQELREKANHYLNNSSERYLIAAAARQRVLSEHTYEHRMLELLGVIAAARSKWEPRAGGLPTAEEIIRQAGVESELAQIMKRHIGQGPLTLEAVAQTIEQGEGDLLRTEAMILLLNEFRRWGLEKGVM